MDHLSMGDLLCVLLNLAQIVTATQSEQQAPQHNKVPGSCFACRQGISMLGNENSSRTYLSLPHCPLEPVMCLPTEQSCIFGVVHAVHHELLISGCYPDTYQESRRCLKLDRDVDELTGMKLMQADYCLCTQGNLCNDHSFTDYATRNQFVTFTGRKRQKQTNQRHQVLGIPTKTTMPPKKIEPAPSQSQPRNHEKHNENVGIQPKNLRPAQRVNERNYNHEDEQITPEHQRRKWEILNQIGNKPLKQHQADDLDQRQRFYQKTAPEITTENPKSEKLETFVNKERMSRSDAVKYNNIIKVGEIGTNLIKYSHKRSANSHLVLLVTIFYVILFQFY